MGKLLRSPIGKARPAMAAAVYGAGQGTGQLWASANPLP